MTIDLPCPGESACAAPQNSAAASEASTTQKPRCSRPISFAKPESATRSGAASDAPRESVGGGSSVGAKRRLHRRDVERALEEILRVRAQLVARAVRVPADDDLLPTDAIRVVRVVVRDGAGTADLRAAKQHLEPSGAQAARADRMRECGLAGDELAPGGRRWSTRSPRAIRRAYARASMRPAWKVGISARSST